MVAFTNGNVLFSQTHVIQMEKLIKNDYSNRGFQLVSLKSFNLNQSTPVLFAKFGTGLSGGYWMLSAEFGRERTVPLMSAEVFSWKLGGRAPHHSYSV